tara:strand:- start:2840 stop:3739 length:900 start_codon:yes stop_codon:yes gene_type:complete
MDNNPRLNNYSFITDGPIFMGANRTIKDCEIIIYGVPYDGTTSFNPGTRFGPDAIKQVSSSLETYCPKLKVDLGSLNYADLGLLEIPHGPPEKIINLVSNVTKEIVNVNKKQLIIGGEHSISVGSVKSLADIYPDLIVIQLDAHADLRDEWLGSEYNHACTMRRILDFIPSKNLLQVGIRSGTKSEFEELNKSNRLINIYHGQAAIELKKSLQEHCNKPVYLTLDLDWFDPSVMPGTGTPEPGGFLWQDFESILDILKDQKVVAADVMELSPKLDHSEISSLLAAKVIRSLLILMSKGN